MIIISFLLLIGPGLVVWKICDNREMTTGIDVFRAVLTVILDCFILFIASYLTLFLIYGKTDISFSTAYLGNVGKSVYSASFVWKYGVMAGVYGIILGCIKVIIRKIQSKQKAESENDKR